MQHPMTPPHTTLTHARPQLDGSRLQLGNAITPHSRVIHPNLNTHALVQRDQHTSASRALHTHPPSYTCTHAPPPGWAPAPAAAARCSCPAGLPAPPASGRTRTGRTPGPARIEVDGGQQTCGSPRPCNAPVCAHFSSAWPRSGSGGRMLRWPSVVHPPQKVGPITVYA